MAKVRKQREKCYIIEKKIQVLYETLYREEREIIVLY